MVAGKVRNKPLHGSWRFRFGRSVISYYRCAIRDVTVGDLARNGHLESRAPQRNSGFEAVLPDGDIEFEEAVVTLEGSAAPIVHGEVGAACFRFEDQGTGRGVRHQESFTGGWPFSLRPAAAFGLAFQAHRSPDIANHYLRAGGSRDADSPFHLRWQQNVELTGRALLHDFLAGVQRLRSGRHGQLAKETVESTLYILELTSVRSTVTFTE